MESFALAEYIWLDGSTPVRQIRSKSRVVPLTTDNPTVNDFPEWSFDGSSTQQATGDDSDCSWCCYRFGDGDYFPAP